MLVLVIYYLFELKIKNFKISFLNSKVDSIKYAALPVLKRFLGSDDGLEFKIIKRGAKPGGGGQVFFRCPSKLKLIPVNLTDPGKIKRIRGIAYAMRVAPAICNRLVETSKGVLLIFQRL